MKYQYNIYGICLETNKAISGLSPSITLNEPDVRVSLNISHSSPTDSREDGEILYFSDCLAKNGKPLLIVQELDKGSWIRLLYSDNTEFLINRNRSEILATWYAPLTLEDTATYLLGPVLGFLLRLRGTVVLHGSAINFNQQAIVLFGEAGAGKSTTAAAFAMLGYPILSEDVVPLLAQHDSFIVQLGYPLIRLWPESVKILFGSSDELPLLTPNWDKRYLDLTKKGYKFQQKPLPLGAIYVLGERQNNPTSPFVEPILPQEALINLVSNTYTNYLLDNSARAHEFEVLGQLMKRVPVRRIIPHKDPARLPALCDVILNDFHNLTAAAVAS